MAERIPGSRRPVSTTVDVGGEAVIVVVCDDGTVWGGDGVQPWKQFPAVPGTPADALAPFTPAKAEEVPDVR